MSKSRANEREIMRYAVRRVHGRNQFRMTFPEQGIKPNLVG